MQCWAVHAVLGIYVMMCNMSSNGKQDNGQVATFGNNLDLTLKMMLAVCNMRSNEA